MVLSRDQIAAVAQWEPIQDGFGRDNPRTRDRIESIIEQINSTNGFACELVQDDGLSNYFLLFSYRKADDHDDVPFPKCRGLFLQLSVCGAIGIAGRIARCVGALAFPRLSRDELLNPDEATNELERATIGILTDVGYQLLTRNEISKPIPPGVTVYDPANARWELETVFDVLFTETD